MVVHVVASLEEQLIRQLGKKKMIFFCSVLFKRPGGMCVFAKPSMEQAGDEEQFTHLPLTLQSMLLLLGMEAFYACSENLLHS